MNIPLRRLDSGAGPARQRRHRCRNVRARGGSSQQVPVVCPWRKIGIKSQAPNTASLRSSAGTRTGVRCFGQKHDSGRFGIFHQNIQRTLIPKVILIVLFDKKKAANRDWMLAGRFH